MSLHSPKTPLPLFERLLEINRETFEGGHHDTAYHTLMAALHYAQDSANVEGLLNVAETATRQLAWIDAHAPDYHHSTSSSKGRHGTVSIWTSMINQANARAKMAQQEKPGDVR